MNVKRTVMMAFEAADYGVLVHADRILVYKEKRAFLERAVPGLERFLASRHGPLRYSLGRNEDFDVLYIWDPADDGFGYALNLTAPDLSEWGYCPFFKRSGKVEDAAAHNAPVESKEEADP